MISKLLFFHTFVIKIYFNSLQNYNNPMKYQNVLTNNLHADSTGKDVVAFPKYTSDFFL